MSGFKVGGVDLDTLFELRGGRTPLAPPTGFKVNGVDLNDRYLSLDSPVAVEGSSLSQYKVNGVNLSGLFSQGLLYSTQRVIANDVTANMRFGADVSCSANGLYVIVGTNTNGAYIFTYSGGSWSQQQKITPGFTSNRVTINEDGTRCAVASSGGTNVVVYNRSGSTWTLDDTFDNTNPTQSICIAPDTGVRLITGSSSHNVARVYVRDGSGNWTLEQVITPSGVSAPRIQRYGYSVSMTDEWLIVGDPVQSNDVQEKGYCNIYGRSSSSWLGATLIQTPGGDTETGSGINDRFGFNVYMNPTGDRCIVGCPSWRLNVSDVRGAHYVITRSGSTWTLGSRVNSAFANHEARSGHAVAISGDGSRNVVGAPGVLSGSGGVAHRQTGQPVKMNYGGTGSFMGNSIYMSSSGNVVVIAAQDEDIDASNGGGVYIYNY